MKRYFLQMQVLTHRTIIAMYLFYGTVACHPRVIGIESNRGISIELYNFRDKMLRKLGIPFPRNDMILRIKDTVNNTTMHYKLKKVIIIYRF